MEKTNQPDQRQLNNRREFYPDLFNPYYFVRKGLMQHIRQQAPVLGGRLLDFGCGSKPYQHLFSVTEYIGVDYYNEGHPHENEHIDVFYDGKTLPFPDGHFDSALCTEVFEHVFNLETVLAELNRVLKPGGKILITCPFVWNEHEVPFDYARYTQFALRDLLTRHGFEILDFGKSGNFVTTVAQLRILYFKTIIGKSWSRFFLTRWLYKFLFILIPNSGGLLASRIFPENTSLYLNNIVLAQKTN